MHIHRARGQSLVEMTLIATILLTILMGTVDVALALNTRLSIRQAVAEAGYFASQNPYDDAGIRASVRNELSGLNPPITDSDITINRTGCGGASPQTTISVSYDYQPIFAGMVLSTMLELTGETTVPQFGGC